MMKHVNGNSSLTVHKKLNCSFSMLFLYLRHDTLRYAVNYRHGGISQKVVFFSNTYSLIFRLLFPHSFSFYLIVIYFLRENYA